jgi:hypothetical protein
MPSKPESSSVGSGTPHKLTADSIPPVYAAVNLRTLLSPSQWDRIRRQAYAEAGHRCTICQFVGRLHAHEQWEYEETARLLRLTGILVLCLSCHAVKHLVRTEHLASQGVFDLEGIVAHFMAVNGCDRAVFDAHLCDVKEVRETWLTAYESPGADNMTDWRLDLGEYTTGADLMRLVRATNAAMARMLRLEQEGKPIPDPRGGVGWLGPTQDGGIWSTYAFGEVELRLLSRERTP